VLDGLIILSTIKLVSTARGVTATYLLAMTSKLVPTCRYKVKVYALSIGPMFVTFSSKNSAKYAKTLCTIWTTKYMNLHCVRKKVTP